ncbi:MAG: bifunctional methylenetetrahydrofolate dehydrogenase/methenyltetrahydrofolate cyclohydrolase FolD [Methanoregulaceae archaeon]
MTVILDGKKTSEQRLAALAEKIREAGLTPRLATVIAGNDPASQMYVRMKHKACGQVGIASVGVELPETATTEEVVAKVTSLNRDPAVDGILVQLPLPKQVDTGKVIAAVSVEKDVDGFHPMSLGHLFSGKPKFTPCTPQGIMTLLSEYNIPLAGARAVIAGRSIDVGRPMAALLLNADATVTICHSRTKDLAGELKRADILVSAIGKAKFITPDMVKPGATIIDVGINHVDGKLCGDVDFEAVKDITGAITPVPGGVGPMTIATLMENTWKAAAERTCNRAR